MAPNRLTDILSFLPIDSVCRFTRENGLWCVTIHIHDGDKESVFVYAGATTIGEAADKFLSILKDYETRLYESYLTAIANQTERATS